MRVPMVFVDANVLYSKTLRDWLLLLRIETGGTLFTVVSSNDTIVEALYWIRKDHPDGPGHQTGNVKDLLERTLDDIVPDFPGGMVFPGDDKHDVHVHAAATACGATYVITDDQGFHAITDELAYEVHTADSFFQLVAENVPQAVDEVIRKQLGYYGQSGSTVTLVEALREAQCPTFAAIVDQHLRAMADGHTTNGIAASVEPVPLQRPVAEPHPAQEKAANRAGSVTVDNKPVG